MQALINKCNKEHSSSIHLLEAWPENSPDLNPIEKVWAWAKAKVEALGLKTFEEYQAAVLDTVQSVPTKMLRRCCKTYSQRLKEVIKSGGGTIKH